MKHMLLWCDGSQTQTRGKWGKPFIGCGVVAFDGTGERLEWAIPLGQGTDSQAELLAVIKALKKVADRPGTHVTVYTDSAYAIDMISGGKVARSNLWLVEAAKALKDECGSFAMKKSRAHSGDPLNDAADKLAKRGAREALAAGAVEDLEI
jgi:ribonuclease HI